MISFTNSDIKHCTATWYKTSRHKRVHRDYSTAAFNLYRKEKFNSKGDKIQDGSILLVTNVSNGKSDTVVITDRHTNTDDRIDLSISSFKKLDNHKKGKLSVIVKLIKL